MELDRPPETCITTELLLALDCISDSFYRRFFVSPRSKPLPEHLYPVKIQGGQVETLPMRSLSEFDFWLAANVPANAKVTVRKLEYGTIIEVMDVPEVAAGATDPTPPKQEVSPEETTSPSRLLSLDGSLGGEGDGGNGEEGNGDGGDGEGVKADVFQN